MEKNCKAWDSGDNSTSIIVLDYEVYSDSTAKPSGLKTDSIVCDLT